MDTSKKTFKLVTTKLNELMTKAASVSNEALNDCVKLITDRLVEATPVGELSTESRPHTRDSWKDVTKFFNVKYIFNEAESKDGIPILNLLEFSEKGKPFARETFNDCFSEMDKIIQNALDNINIEI